MQSEIIYVGDPMCSWCYGFSSVIQTLFRKYRNSVRMTLRMGGLHPGNDYVVTDAYRRFLLGHWNEIAERTGQRFSFGILDKLGWIYDTEKACRAAVVVRTLRPGSEYPYFAAIQAGFYALNRDPHDPDSFAEAAAEFGIAREEFLAAYADDAVKAETAGDFEWARSLGVNGFPTVLVRDRRGLAVLTRGYQPLQALEEPLATWLGTCPPDSAGRTD